MGYQEFTIEGRNAVIEAYRSGKPIDKLFILDGCQDGPMMTIKREAKKHDTLVKYVTKERLDQLSETGKHQGVIAYAAAYEYAEVDDILEAAKKKGEPPFIFLLDNIEDPHNLGAIIRTANLAGAHGVIIPKNRAAGLTATVARTSAGALNYTPVAKVTNLAKTIEDLKKEGLWFVCADMGGTTMYDLDLKGPIGLVIGNEGEGVGRLVKEKCDMVASIPMKGDIDSLNASVAAGLRDRTSETARITDRCIRKQDIKGERMTERFKYEDMTDEELIDQLREGDRQVMDYICDKYKNLVRSKAKSMYILGGDSEDLIQEGMIGLFKAVRDYDCGRDASFYTFADLCISRQMYTAVQASQRLKHTPLNTYVSLDSHGRMEEDRDPETQTLAELLTDKTGRNPEELFLDKERVAYLEKRIATELSELERQVLDLYITGMSYTQIAKVLRRSEKATENALTRAKQKIRSFLSKESKF